MTWQSGSAVAGPVRAFGTGWWLIAGWLVADDGIVFVFYLNLFYYETFFFTGRSFGCWLPGFLRQ